MNICLFIFIYAHIKYICIHLTLNHIFHLIIFHEHFPMQLFVKTVLLNDYIILYLPDNVPSLFNHSLWQAMSGDS